MPGQNTVYPSEWHDADVGLVPHVCAHHVRAATRSLLKALTARLSRTAPPNTHLHRPLLNLSSLLLTDAEDTALGGADTLGGDTRGPSASGACGLVSPSGA